MSARRSGTLRSQRVLIVLLLALMLVPVSCARRSMPIATHPEFAPLVPRSYQKEIQITWSRSWQPMIYLRATLHIDKYDKESSAQLWYSISDRSLKPLKRLEIKVADWQAIEEALEESGFWGDDLSCLEKAYREESYSGTGVEPCSELGLTDAASISVAASDGSRARGVQVICPLDDDPDPWQNCGSLGEVAKVMLAAMGKDRVP